MRIATRIFTLPQIQVSGMLMDLWPIYGDEEMWVPYFQLHESGVNKKTKQRNAAHASKQHNRKCLPA